MMKLCKTLAIVSCLCFVQFAASRPRTLQSLRVSEGNVSAAPVKASDPNSRRPLVHKLVPPGSTVRIICRISPRWNKFLGWYRPDGYRVNGVLPWFHRLYVARKGRAQHTLVIQNVNVNDGGRYVCRGTRSSSSFILLVAFQVNAPANQNIGSVGGNGTVQLGVKGFPRSTYLWRKDSKELDIKNSRYSIARDGSLTIINLKPSDAGIYTCTIHQLFGKKSQTVSIKVSVKPAAPKVPKEYPAEENPGDNFIEGDIYVDKNTQTVMEGLLGRDALSNPIQRWPNGVVPYKYAGSFGQRGRIAFEEAIEEYSKHTCIRFIPRTNQRDYVYIVSEKGCFSTIGRSGKWQKLSLGPRCQRKGTAIHEIMHALGFFHEQSRLDRDNYVTINWGNIKEDMKSNFRKYRHGDADTLGEPYDYDSIMHYPEYAFSSNYRPTIVKKRQGPVIGQRTRLSAIDIRQINKLYKCSTTSSPTPPQTTTAKPTTKPTTTPTTEPTTKPLPTTKAPRKCHDSQFGCRYFAFYGYCRHYRYDRWMRKYCPRSCRVCR